MAYKPQGGIGNKYGLSSVGAKQTAPTSNHVPTAPVQKPTSGFSYQQTQAQTPSVASFQSTSNKTLKTDVDSYVNQFQKVKSSVPKLPDQIDLDKYRTDLTSIRDIEKKYGFDFSRDYAERQAGVVADSKRDEILSQRERLEYETEASKTDLEHGYFNQFLTQRQGMADAGINAGLASERNLQLGIAQQNDLAEIIANQQLENQDLDRQESTITKEEQAAIEQMYNDRLSEGFGMAMDQSRFQQSDNQWRAQMAQQQRNQQVEEAWRAHEFNNMSVSEQTKLKADAERYGLEQAWERHKFDAGLAFDAAYSGSGGSSGGFLGTGGAGDFTQFRVTSQFGKRKSPTAGASSNHKGMDFGTPMNTPVGSPVSGKVIRSGSTGGFGTYVAVQDGNGLVHIFAHLNATNVKVGQTVNAGSILAKSGNSGVSTGPHLHYEVRQGGMSGTSIDPSQFLGGGK